MIVFWIKVLGRTTIAGDGYEDDGNSDDCDDKGDEDEDEERDPNFLVPT